MEGTEQNKIVVITGATGSMGAVATREMAREGYTIIMACRNLKKADEVRHRVLGVVPYARLELCYLDLSSLLSVRKFVAQLAGRSIFAVFNNAGIMAHSYTLSSDGFEMDMATNFIGNALLCELLVPQMEYAGRIVNMVSLTTKYAHMDAGWREWSAERFSQLGTYASSKLALLLYSIGLARRNPHLCVNVSDPGIVDSDMITMGKWYDRLADLFFRPLIKSPECGVQSAIQALHSSDTMCYFVGNKSKKMPRRFADNLLVDDLWCQLQEIFVA